MAILEAATLEPAILRGKTATLLHDFLHLLFVDYRNSQFLRLVELRPRIGSRHDVVGFFTDRAGYFPPGVFDHLLGFVAGEVRQRPGEDESLPRELRAAFFFLALEREARLAQAVDQFAVGGDAEELGDAFSDTRADLVHILQFFDAGMLERFHRSEMFGEKLRRSLANHTNP